MGRNAGRTKRLPLASRTVSELMQAVARDFENARMEESARKLIRRRGERLTPVDDHHEMLRREHQELLSGPKRQTVLNHLQRLERALQRPRGQPAKYPELDTAIVTAVRRGESPARVVDMALAALRVVTPELRPTPELRRRFLDRLKNRRKIVE